MISGVYGSPVVAAWLFLRGKVVPDQSQELLDIMADVLLTPKFDNKERVRQIVLEERAGFESRLTGSRPVARPP